MTALHRLWEHGQSCWIDNLTRGMLASGELERRVSTGGVRGVTSNPAIFHKAITEGDDYRNDIARFAEEGLSPSKAYERLAIADVKAACDVLRGVWEESEGVDGYVSLEVDPGLAHDADATFEDACRLHSAVDRENVLIKIPGTEAGLRAIRQVLFEGVSVNVTLLFSLEAYDAAAEAYVEALEQRREAGLPVDGITSVASFFLSRIDTLVDRRIAELANSARTADGAGAAESAASADKIASLCGQAAVAKAKLAYRSFTERLGTERWDRLAKRGARPQRILWASTSAKNPAYSDVKYVEPLIGDLTINTMPQKTIAAFSEHGRVASTLAQGVDQSHSAIKRLSAAGIDFEEIARQLLAEGIEKFVAPFARLMDSLETELAAGRREVAAVAV